MAMEANYSSYQQGLELAEQGKYQEALECIQGYLRVSPNDVEALNDAGAILYCLGRTNEAINHFIKARNLKPESGEIMWNLAEAYLAEGQAAEVIPLFDDMQQMGIINPDVLNRTATVLINQGDKSNAIEVLLHSLQIWPEQQVLKPMLDKICSLRPKIAFFCGGDGMGFLNEIIEFTKQRFEVKIFEGQTEDKLYELMKWSDISWFEWCTNLAVIASNMPKVCKNIVRLHRYEAYEQWPQQINWSNIDILVTVGNAVTKQTLINKIPNLETQTQIVTIPNSVNVEKFKFVNRDRGKNIAFLANLRMVKNPAFMLQCMQKLHCIDPEYRLFFGGVVQDEVLEQYLRQTVESLGLGGVVFFDGWQEDVNVWLQDKDFIVSTSICEGYPVGILEGMTCGLKPVIHNFLGAESIFPSEFLFNITEEFCEKILSDTYEPERYRNFVEEKCSLKDQLSKINSIFTQFEYEITSNSPLAETDVGLCSQASDSFCQNKAIV